LFGATLTLPGLAGLALTAGMAVDSNVIIFERIKDEIKLGAQRDAAVRAGFDRALSAIRTSNIKRAIKIAAEHCRKNSDGQRNSKTSNRTAA